MRNTYAMGELEIRGILETLLSKQDPKLLRAFFARLQREYPRYIHPDIAGERATEKAARVNRVIDELVRLEDDVLLEAVRAYVETGLSIGYFAQQEHNRILAEVERAESAQRRAKKEAETKTHNLELAEVAFQWMAEARTDARHPCMALRGYLFFTRPIDLLYSEKQWKGLNFIRRAEITGCFLSQGGRLLTGQIARSFSLSRYVTSSTVKEDLREPIYRQAVDLLRDPSESEWTDSGLFLGLASWDSLTPMMGMASGHFKRPLSVVELGGLIQRFLLKDVPQDLTEPLPPRKKLNEEAPSVRELALVAITPHDAKTYDIIALPIKKDSYPPLPPLS